MSQQQTSQSQKTTGSFWGAGLFEEQLGRVEALYRQIEELENRAVEQVRGGIDEAARLAKESWAYGARLSREWREAALEVVRRAWAGCHGR
jgi:hypothetical protein